MRVLVRKRLACAARHVAACLCDAAPAEVAFWVAGPPPPDARTAFGPPPAPGKRPPNLIARLRPWR